MGAGGTVVLLPGTYRETLRIRRGGEPDRPVTFRAADPGTAVISGTAPDSVIDALRWRHDGDALWSTATPWPVYHVAVDGMDLYHVRWGDARRPPGERRKIDVLREIVGRDGAWPAFAWEDGRLHLALPDGRAPGARRVSFHRRIPPPYASWTMRSANVWVEADHVVFEGLRFEMGVGAGLLLWSARDVTVRDCAFGGAAHGIRAFPRVRRPDGLVVERSLYDHYPQGRWLEGWLTWREVYRHHASSTLVRAEAGDVVVRGNVVAHGGDGLQLTTPASPGEGGIEIAGNLFFRGTDDAIQMDGYARDVSIHDNVVYDWFVGLGLSPVLGGPVLVERNVFLQPDEEMAGAHLKFLDPGQNRPRDRGRAIRDVAVSGNLFVGGYASWANAPARNVWVVDNVFAGTADRARWPDGAVREGNAFEPLSEDGLDGACARLERRSRSDPDVPAGFRSLRERPGPASRPGPAWLEYGRDPATAGILEALPGVVTEGRCG